MASRTADASALPPPPLCVDLDGTLIRGDTLAISAVLCARRRPFSLPVVGLALLRGRAAFKDAMARRVLPDPAQLPWRDDVLAFVREEKRRGRRVWLTTAAHRRVAECVAQYLGCFDGIIATEGAENAKGAGKVAAIRRTLGDTPFDYVGDSIADLPVLEAARVGHLVAPSRRLREEAARVARIERIFE
jgi:phosphoserine phosphatase